MSQGLFLYSTIIVIPPRASFPFAEKEDDMEEDFDIKQYEVDSVSK